MISETEIVDQWAVICDCIAKPDESTQALELLTTSMFTEPGCLMMLGGCSVITSTRLERNRPVSRVICPPHGQSWRNLPLAWRW